MQSGKDLSAAVFNRTPLYLLFAMLGLLGPFSVNAAIIDFEGATTGFNLTDDYFEDGFVMSLEVGERYTISNPPFGNGTNVLGLNELGTADDTVRFSRAGTGGLFNLLSLDVLDTDDEENGGFLTASNGSSMALGSAALGTNAFGAGWENLSWIELSISDANLEWASIDNIELQEVPEPATLGLMAMSLLGLSLRKRWTNQATTT